MLDGSQNVSPSRAGEIRRIVFLLIAGLLLASLGLRAVKNGVVAGRNALSLDDSSYPECAVVERALAAAHGEPVYVNPNQWPYATAVYGPLAYYPVGLAARLAGLKEGRFDEARQVYLAGRAVSFAAGLAIVAWLWFMGGGMGLAGGWRLLPPLFFLSCHFILDFWDTFRPDFPMVAIALWAWAVALRKKGALSAAAAAVLMAAAVFFKIPAILSAGALGLWLLLDGRRRDFLSYAAVLGLLLAAGGAFLMIATRGFWWENNVRALQSPFRLRAAWEFLFWLKDLDLIALAGGLAACLGVAASPANSARETNGPDAASPSFRAARWAFALAFLGAELLVMRTGSNINYYLETYCWGALLAGVCVRACAREQCAREQGEPGAGKPAPRPALILAACLLLAPALYSLDVTFLQLRQEMRPVASWQKVNYQLAFKLRKTTGEILLVEGYAWWFTQSPPTMLDPFLFSVRVASGALPSSGLVEKIRRRDFELILLPWNIAETTPSWQDVPTLPEEVVSAIKTNYRLDARLGSYFLHVPESNPEKR